MTVLDRKAKERHKRSQCEVADHRLVSPGSTIWNKSNRSPGTPILGNTQAIGVLNPDSAGDR